MAGRRSARRQVIVVGRTKLREQDLILTMLATQGEQVRAVAKGARKPGARLAARTELFCETDVLLSEGRGLAIVTEAELVDAHTPLRADVERLSAASVVCELARLASYEDVADPYLFAITRKTLQVLEPIRDVAHLYLILAAYLFKVLSHGGWMPVLDCCIACGERPATRFSVASGGLLCESCATGVAGAEPIDEGHVAWLRALIGSTYEVLGTADVDDRTASYLFSLAHSWASTHLDARMRAAEFFGTIA